MGLNLESASLIGEGEWVRGTAYRVYKCGSVYWAVIVNNRVELHIDLEGAVRIEESDIKYYIYED